VWLLQYLLISRRVAALIPSGITGLTDYPFSPPLISMDTKFALATPLETFQYMRDRRGIEMDLVLYPMSIIRSIDFDAFRPLLDAQAQAPEINKASTLVPPHGRLVSPLP
jgi:hypothetical protein